MNRFLWVVALSGWWGIGFCAQGPNPIATFVRDALTKNGPRMIQIAMSMPADRYGMKGPPDDVTFGYLILHIADANFVFCSLIGGVPTLRLPAEIDTAPKDALVERLKTSFDACTTSLAGLDDSGMSDVLTMPDKSQMSRAMAILAIAGSWTTHDQQLDTYLRLSGAAPPQ